MARADFAAAVRSAVEGVWTGALQPAQGTTALVTACATYLREAWYAGAETCGILPDELTPTEESELLNFVLTQQAFAGRFLQDVRRTRQAGGKLGSMLSRADLWVQRYAHARERGKQNACSDLKYRWVLGATEEHCTDCLAAEGRVHRASIWQKYGWQPGARTLACGGWRCDCRFERTNEPALPGHPPYPRG